MIRWRIDGQSQGGGGVSALIYADDRVVGGLTNLSEGAFRAFVNQFADGVMHDDRRDGIVGRMDGYVFVEIAR